MAFWGTFVAVLGSLSTARAAFDLAFPGSDDDLSRYVTRPEIRAPLFKVTEHEPAEVTPGYWFIAPYAKILQEHHADNYYQACQTGPAIYDSKGELIWSGACLVKNQNSCDFRVFTANGSTFLSSILTLSQPMDSVGLAIVLDASMQVVQEHRTPHHLVPFNMHEFSVINNGASAMYIIQRTDLADVSHIKDSDGTQSGIVINMGIREFDMATGKDIFTWWAHDHMNHNASTFPVRYLHGPYPMGWDWIHLNAVDKNDEGDYLVTARYTDAVYKINGKDGHIMWTLGGVNSSFKLEDFIFSRPHDARFLSSDASSETITLLDNGGCEESVSSDVSSSLILHLDKSKNPWVARVQKRWTRPDGGRSDKRGNFQLLSNGNAFTGWSENSYISEHSPDGRLLMEAQWTSKRFVTYRAYKFNFTSSPSEPPVLKGYVYGETPERAVSVYYVSWNGATEVSAWEFYDENRGLLGRKSRSGFETMFQQSSRYAERVYAQAVASDGTILGRTEVEVITNPTGWANEDSDATQESDEVPSVDMGKTEL